MRGKGGHNAPRRSVGGAEPAVFPAAVASRRLAQRTQCLKAGSRQATSAAAPPPSPRDAASWSLSTATCLPPWATAEADSGTPPVALAPWSLCALIPCTRADGNSCVRSRRAPLGRWNQRRSGPTPARQREELAAAAAAHSKALDSPFHAAPNGPSSPKRCRLDQRRSPVPGGAYSARCCREPNEEQKKCSRLRGRRSTAVRAQTGSQEQ